MAKLIFEHQLERMYCEMLDDVYGTVSICGLEYCASDALKATDPTAFRCGFLDWLDAEVKDGNLFEDDGEYYDSDPKEEENV
jgi:hypothetical protein